MNSRRTKNKIIATRAAQLQVTETVRRMLKLTIVTLHDEFGFGRDRLAQFVNAFNAVCSEAETDEVFWGHVDRICESVGVEFVKERDE